MRATFVVNLNMTLRWASSLSSMQPTWTGEAYRETVACTASKKSTTAPLDSIEQRAGLVSDIEQTGEGNPLSTSALVAECGSPLAGSGPVRLAYRRQGSLARCAAFLHTTNCLPLLASSGLS